MGVLGRSGQKKKELGRYKKKHSGSSGTPWGREVSQSEIHLTRRLSYKEADQRKKSWGARVGEYDTT